MIIWWALGLLAMTVLTMLFYPSFKSGGFDQAFTALPKGLQKIVGTAADFKTIGGYIGQEIFALRIPLLMAILSIVTFNSLFVAEERKGVLESQLSLPLNRIVISIGKLFSAITIIVLASIGVFVGVLLGVLLVHEHYSAIKILQETLSCVLLSLNFGLVVFMVWGIVGTSGLTLGVACAFTFLSYLVSSMASSVSWLQPLDKLSFFHYYNNTATFNLFDTSVLLAIAASLSVLGLVFFLRRDVKT